MAMLIFSIVFVLVVVPLTLVMHFSATPPSVLLSAILIFCSISLLVTSIQRYRKIRRAKRADKQLGVVVRVAFTHVSGLPFADGAVCTVLLLPQEFLFLRGETQVHLPFAKILDVACKTEEEIRSSYVSSVGGTVAGYALFGTAGAIIGGQPKKISDTTLTRYLMIAYDDGGKIANIVLECGYRWRKGDKIVQYVREKKAAEGRKNIQL